MTFLFLTFSNLSLFTKAAKSLREKMDNWPKIVKTKIEMFQIYLRWAKDGVSAHRLDNAALMPWLESFTRLSPSLVSNKLTGFWPINFVRYDLFRNGFVVGNDIDQTALTRLPLKRQSSEWNPWHFGERAEHCSWAANSSASTDKGLQNHCCYLKEEPSSSRALIGQ